MFCQNICAVVTVKFCLTFIGQIRLPEVIKKLRPLRKRKQQTTEPVMHRLGIDTKAPKLTMLEHREPIKQPAKLMWPKPEVSQMVPLG